VLNIARKKIKPPPSKKKTKKNLPGFSSENGKTSAEISPVCVGLGDNV
jgi:hypothetical protein